MQRSMIAEQNDPQAARPSQKYQIDSCTKPNFGSGVKYMQK